MPDDSPRRGPLASRDARRLALLFAVVYFAQGMWYLPNQTITIVLKDLGYGAGQVATFFSITTLPWVIKPVYGAISDFVPLMGRRRRSYFLLTTALAAGAGAALALAPAHPYAWLAALFTLMGLGLAFTDVLTDALMVEGGRAHGLTGTFQSVQWAAINASSIVVGFVGGYLAETRHLAGAFTVATAFPIVSFVMALAFVREAPRPAVPGQLRRTLTALAGLLRRADAAVVLMLALVFAVAEAIRGIRETDTMMALGLLLLYGFWVGTRGQPELRAVAGFILFWTFSPSFGPALVYYQTDTLTFSQQFIGVLSSLYALGAIAGAALYAPLSRRVPLRRLIVVAIGVASAGTLLYLFYRNAGSAIAIELVFGCIGMMTQLAFMDLAAKACPAGIEATFFALLMSVYNLGTQGSQIAGGHLYDWLGYTPLILISAGMTAAAWLLVPWVRIDAIQARAAER